MKNKLICVCAAAMLMLSGCSGKPIVWTEGTKLQNEFANEVPEAIKAKLDAPLLSEEELADAKENHPAQYEQYLAYYEETGNYYGLEMTVYDATTYGNFVVKNYGINQAVNASYSEIYVTDGSDYKLIKQDLSNTINDAVLGDDILYCLNIEGELFGIDKEGNIKLSEQINSEDLFYCSIKGESNEIGIYSANGTKISTVSVK